MLQPIRDPSRIFTDQVVTEASYIIFGEDTDGDGILDIIYAKNGRTGQIDFQGTDASKVINKAIQSLPNGGKIHLCRGGYLLYDTILIDRPIALVGAGRALTVLKLANDVNKNVIETTKKTHWLSPYIASLTINGNKDYNVSGNGIEIFGSEHGIIENVEIENAPVYGIKIYGESGNPAIGVMLRNVVVRLSGDSGILLGSYSSDNSIVTCGVGNAGRHGIDISASPNNSIIDTAVWNSAQVGIYVNGDRTQIISLRGGGIVNNGAGIGILKNYCIVIGTRIALNRHEGLVLQDGLYNRVIGCLIHDNEYGIYEKGTTDYNAIIGNLIINNTIDNVIKVGANTVVKNNHGYITENSGTTTITGDGVTTTFTVDIAHGLVSDKVVGKITLDRDGTIDKVYLVDTDADGVKETLRVQVTFATAPASGESVPIYWSAEVVG